MYKEKTSYSLYLVQGSTVTGVAAVFSLENSDSHTTHLWHMRLGHISERDMMVLRKNIVCFIVRIIGKTRNFGSAV